MLLRNSSKLFIKIFIKVLAVRHSKWKVFQKQTFHLTSTIYLLLRCSTESKYNYANVKTIHPISLTFFSSLLSFDSRVFIFFVFSISSNNCKKLNSISCGICLSCKSNQLEFFCKIFIQQFFTGICLEVHLGPPWQEVHLYTFTTLENICFSCTAVNGCFQSFN